MELVVANPHRDDVAVIAKVHDVFSRALLYLTSQVRNLVVPVQMNLVCLTPNPGSVEELLGNVRVAGRRKQCREHVDVRDNAVKYRARLDLAWPTNEAWHA